MHHDPRAWETHRAGRPAWLAAASALTLSLLAGLANPARAQGTGKFGGQMFGDFYWMARNHDSTRTGQNGFWFRRIYFTYDQDLGQSFAARLRFELNSPGDFKTNDKLVPYVKDAYLRWARGQHQLFFGISPTPTWELIETVWGYRSVEKTPLDLQRMGDSRDFGVAALGHLDRGGRLEYHAMLANGAGTRAETDKYKSLYLAVNFQPWSRVVLQAYGDWQDHAGTADWFTVQGFAAYRAPGGRLGLQMAHQTRRSGFRAPDLRLTVGSAFGVIRLGKTLSGFGRIDRMFEPNPEGEKIPYLPFSAVARSWLALAGLDFAPAPNVHLMPNLELVRYDKVGASRPAADVMARVTAFFAWN
jgi:hypothetical protein